MGAITSKTALAIALSRLKGFSKPKVRLEQYATDPDVAAQLLWTAYMQGDLEGKKIADLGAGTGILGIGALLLGAAEVLFVESESSALELCQENLLAVKDRYGFEGSYRVIEADIEDFEESCDTVVENPPFGTKTAHMDRIFLEKAMKTARSIYTLHKTTSRGFIQAISRDHGFSAVEAGAFSYPLPATMAHHTKKRTVIEVSFFVLRK